MSEIKVRVEQGHANESEYAFTDSFRIGRDGNCQVMILDDSSISRTHAEVVLERDQWLLRDLNSTNGSFVDGKKIDCIAIAQPLHIQLGTGSTLLLLTPAADDMPEDARSMTQYVRHYFDRADGGGAGQHTVMIRKAFQLVQAKQKRKYAGIVATLSVLLLLAAGYAFLLHREATQQKERASSIFYAMKALELEISGISQIIEESKNQKAIEVVRKYRVQRKEMESNYDQFLQKLKVYHSKLSEVDRLILRVARIFGESEINMPPDFVAEVQNYIKKWKSSDRLEKAINIVRGKGYAKKISEEMLARDLPPQFLYLALQESNFDVYSVGPMTYKGHAKGMWQFIPETAVKYGLRVGPLVDLGRPDPADDRHNFEKATNAAARYLQFIYSTEAQASGLLVMSSYNWGEERIVNLLRTMPANPKDRNFWRLLASYRDKIPQETYDYVYYIFSAAVIGENPQLFGFKFENPLAYLDR